jgi:aspartate 1-decarboxylase
MILTLMKAKIHRATITQAELDYVGSLTLDPDLMEAVGMRPNERVHVMNIEK